MSVNNLKVSSLHCQFTDGIRNSSSQAILINDVAICVINIVIILLNLPANGFVVYTYIRSRSRQPVCNTLLFMMATFDLLRGIMSQPPYVAIKILEAQNIHVCWLENVSTVLLVVFGGSSFIMGTLVLTSERLFAVVYPIRHRFYTSKRRSIVASLSLFVAWTMCVICLPQIGHNAWLVIALCVIVLGLVYPVAVYIKIYSISRKSKAFINANAVASNKTRSRGSHLKSETRSTDGNRDVNGVSNKNTPEPKRLPLTAMTKTKGLGNNSTNSMHRDGAISATEIPEGSNLNHYNPSNEIALPEIANRHEDSVLEILGDSPDAPYHPNAEESSLTTIKGINNECTLSTLEVCCEFEYQNPCQKLKSQCVQRVKRAQDVCHKFTLNCQEKRMILRMLGIIGALYVCQLPMFFLFLYAARHDEDFLFVKYLFPWGTTFSFVSSVVNPFIYCYRNEHFWVRRTSRQSVST